MAQAPVPPVQPARSTRQQIALGLIAVFFTEFISFVFINARNIAFPVIINEFNGMKLFSWLIALPALSGAASTLLFGKLSDIFGRRKILLVSIGIFLLGLGVSAKATTMVWMIAAATFMSIGHFPIVPLCFTVIGDLFPPEERVKWTGLLNLPSGVAALIGPVLGGLVAESLVGWRGIYWGTIPLMLIGAILAVVGLPEHKSQERPKIDVSGTFIMVIATTTLFIGVSKIGSPSGIWLAALLLAISLVAWIIFVRIEKKADAPILDPKIFQNRTFMTAAASGFLMYFGLLGIGTYSPIFVQNVMKIDPTISGSMLTPYSTIISFLGIPTGFLLAKTKKYKWMYIVGFTISTLAIFALWRITAGTPIWVYVLITSIAGLGAGSLPTLNTLVAQFAVPRRLLGAAVGAIYFFQMVSLSVAPSLLGIAQNHAATLETGLKQVFLVGAVTMLAGLILILTIPEIPIHKHAVEDDPQI